MPDTISVYGYNQQVAREALRPIYERHPEVFAPANRRDFRLNDDGSRLLWFNTETMHHEWCDVA